VEPEPLPEQAAAMAAPAAATRVGLLRRNPDFARLYVAQLVSFCGDWFTGVALLDLVLRTTGRATLAGLVLAAQTIPFALVSPFAGVLVDRLDRKRFMVAADVVRALLALGFLAARSEDTIWIAFVCLVLLSSVSAFFDPASSAALPNLVRPADLASANVLMGSAWGTMLVVGAALGGVVAGAFGNDAAFIGDAVSFAVSGALILSIRGRFREADPPRRRGVTIAADVRETVRFARRDRRVLALIAAKAVFGLSAGVIALVAVFATEVFRGGAGTIGLLQSARGLGALTGPFLFRRWAAGREARLFAGLSVAGLVFAAGYGLFAAAPAVGVAALGVACAHVGGGSIWTLSTYGLQRFTPDEIRGRVFSVDYGLTTLGIGASVFLTGLAADRVGPRPVAAGVAAVAAAFSLGWTAWRRRALAGTGARGGEPSRGASDGSTEP
jgi:MFS family permease